MCLKMNNEICDYLFYSNPRFNVSGPCEWTVCKNSMLYRIVMDILKNGPVRDIYTHLVFRKSYYTMCVKSGDKHVHDAAFIVVDTKIERKIVDDMLNMFSGADAVLLRDTFLGRGAEEIRKIITGTVICGTVYTTSFMEHRNNDLPFDHSAKKERIFYIYDAEYNRGHKFFVKHDNAAGDLNVVNRDGDCTVFSHGGAGDAHLFNYIHDCLSEPHRLLIDRASTTVPMYVDYLNLSTAHVVSLDFFINKKYLSAAASLCVLFDKINIMNNERYHRPLWNLKDPPILLGKIPVGHTHEYEKTGIARTVDAKRKTKNFVEKHAAYEKIKPRCRTPSTQQSPAGTGSRITTHGETTIQRMDCENMPTFFKTIESLTLADAMSDYVLRNVPKNVRTVEARILPPDSFKYLDIQCLGSINNSGKSAAFVDGVRVSYGHVDSAFLDSLSAYLKANYHLSDDESAAGRVVFNKIVTRYGCRVPCDYRSILDAMIHVKRGLYKFCAVLPFARPGSEYVDFLSIHLMSGLPFRSFDGLSGDRDVMFCRREIDILYSVRETGRLDEILKPDVINRMLDADDGLSASKIGMRCNSNGKYVLPAKKTVAVNGYKSAIPDRYFKRAAHLISKTTQYFIDYVNVRKRYVPMGCAVFADAAGEQLHVDDWTTVDRLGVPPGDDGGTLKIPMHTTVNMNMVTLPTAFADIDGKNVEDAYVIDRDLNLDMTVTKSYGIQFSCRRARVKIFRAEPGVNPVIISSRDRITGDPLTVTVLIATVKCLDTGAPDPVFINSVLSDGNKYGLNSIVDSSENHDAGQEVKFQQFKKINIYKNTDGEYNVYIQFCDQCIIDRAKKIRGRELRASDVFDEYDVECFSYSDVQEDYCRSYYHSAEKIDFSCEAKMFYIKFQASLNVPIIDGVKLYSLHGNKGVSSAHDFGTTLGSIERWANRNGVPGLVVANNIAMESRTMMGDMLDMKRNFTRIIDLDTGEKMRVGYVNYIVSGLMHSCQASRLKFDTQTQNSMLANGLESVVNSKYSDNIYNLECVAAPGPSRQIMDNFIVTGANFEIDESFDSYGSKRNLEAIEKMYDEICNLKKKKK